MGDERFALDNEAPITSVYEIVGPSHARVTVRWRGVTIGTLTVSVSDLPALRYWLIPGGTDDEAASLPDIELEKADLAIKEEKEGGPF
jgi:hypothetical protein